MAIRYVDVGGKQVKVITKDDGMIINNTRYEPYIRISHYATGEFPNYIVKETDWQNFPMPTSMTRRLHDVDVDAFTDLEGFTHRNRVREDVEDFDVGFAVLNDDDEANLLNMIAPEWFYVELINKKTKQKSVHKMYASDRQWDVYHVWKDSNGDWVEANEAFSVSFVEE